MVWIGELGRELDPSFKPRRITPTRAALLSDMGYDRTNFLACAGGVTTNEWFVQGLSADGVSNELNRLSSNLAAVWRGEGRGAARSVIGADDIVPQDLVSDGECCHGLCHSGFYDVLSWTAEEISPYRARVTVTHGGLTNSVWLDEIGTRTLWLSYTNAPGYDYPKAVLMLDETVLATEPQGSATSCVTAALSVYHPSLHEFGTMSASYSLTRATTNVFVISVGFGAEHWGGMCAKAAEALARLRASGRGADDLHLRAGVLQSVGHHWLAQTALLSSLDSRLKGGSRHFFYNIGMSGQATSPFVDFKNSFTFSTADPSRFDGYPLFASALEHGVLDQVDGPSCPAVSTVRIFDLANAAVQPVYFATTTNWPVIKAALNDYSPSALNTFESEVAAGRKLVLPQSGAVSLGNWSGMGYIDYGEVAPDVYSYGMYISGGLNGAQVTGPFKTPDSNVSISDIHVVSDNAAISNVQGADPVDMLSGAAVIGRSDLRPDGPATLAMNRSYDSRRCWDDGPLGRGWSHGFGSRAHVHAEPGAFLGQGPAAACAASVVACAVVNDVLSAGESAKNFTVACLVAKWWADRLAGGAATVSAGGQTLAFTRLSDGAYEPDPHVTASLICTDGRFELKERLGRTWVFATNGLLSSVIDRSGNALGLSYEGGTNLVSVTNSFGRRLDLSWSGGRITGADDSSGRTVLYAYGPDGCMTGVTDEAGFRWTYSYDADGRLLSESDPSGTPTVRNAYNALGQVTNQLSASGTDWRFAYAGGLASWEADPFLNRNCHGFSAEGRPLWRIERDGAVHAFAYNPCGHLVTNVNALGRLTVSAFDASNRLTRVTEAVGTPDERKTDFVYDGRHRLTAVTNALGRVTSMGYDGHDRLVCVTAPDGVTVTNVYNSRGLLELTRTLDASGNVVRETSAVYNSRGLPEEVTSTDSGTTLYRYDAAGNVTNVTDALGHPLALSYNDRGQLTGTADALGHTTARQYTPEGRLAAAVDALGNTNRFLWTPGGKPAAVIYADGGISTNEYDIADRLSAVRSPRGSRVALGLDAAGRVTNRTASAWSDAAWYDAEGLVTARVDAVSGRTVTDYDWLDRPVAVTDPLGKVWQSAFDALGGFTNAVDPRSRSTAYARDLMGRLAVTRYPSGRTDGNAYDALGRLTAFTNAEDRVFRLSYDAQGRITAATNAAGEQVVRNFYDLCGNLTNRVDAASRRIGYSYDALNRRTGTLYADAAWERFGYDAAGNLTAASNAASRLAFSYDAMNRLASSETRAAGQVFAVGYGCDRGGLVTNVTYPGGLSVRYGYDADGRVTNVTDWAGRSFAFTRDAAGRLNALSYPNGVSGSWTHDANHKVSGWSYNKGSTLAGRTVTRDAAGVKIQESVAAGLFPNPQSPRRAANTFDAADRLVSATVAAGTNTFSETYLYDGNGALTNRQSAVGDQQFEYDCAGRLSYLQLLNPNSSLLLSYDPLGNRLTSYSANTTRIWITDHADPRKRPLMEADANGAPVRYYVWGGGFLLAVVEADGTVRYAHSDEQGSVVALTDLNGTVTDQYCYGPYGTDWGHSGTNAIPFRWLGSHGVHNVGGSSLHLTRYRAYDAYTARFLSSDPLGLGGGPNLYAYCLGNPLAYIDPLGLCGESQQWYDQVASYMAGQVATSKDIVNGSGAPWLLSGTINTVMDLGLGLASYPSAFMHMGEAAGRYSVDPSLENLAGVYSDIALGAGTAAVALSYLPSANVPIIGAKPVASQVPVIVKPLPAEQIAPAPPRFIVDQAGNVVDLQATPQGSYILPNGGRTDILQQSGDHGAGVSHTHNPIVNINPNTGQTFVNGLDSGGPVTAADINNIINGTATLAPPRGR
jgi:RHS repeat-associated protein